MKEETKHGRGCWVLMVGNCGPPMTWRWTDTESQQAKTHS